MADLKAGVAKPGAGKGPVVAFPMSLPAFLAKIRGTKDEVYSRLLHVRHGREKRSEVGWRKAISLIATEKVPVQQHRRVNRAVAPVSRNSRPRSAMVHLFPSKRR